MGVFKAYDVRATYPDPLNEDKAWRIGWATATFLMAEASEAGMEGDAARTLAIGHDMRRSSPALVRALKDGIAAAGGDVIDVGLVDTPCVGFAINHLGCCGGIQTTASHNPARYNGFKISRAKARPVGQLTGLLEIESLAQDVDREGAACVGGRATNQDLWDAYRSHVFTYLDPALKTGDATLTVAIDASNGMAGTMVPKIFSDVPGLNIVELYFDNDSGEFVHDPNPLVAANLADLQQLVIESGADVGICFDGDADRCMIVDEQGVIIGCDLITAWLAQRFLAREPGGSIVYDLRSSHALAEMVREAGGTPVEGRVGHVFMKQMMAEHDAAFGGELSGHFYFRDNAYADSGAMAMAAIASALATDGRPLSEIIAPARRYAQSGEINFEVDDKDAAMARLVAAYPDATVTRLDGVTVDMGRWWCNVRPSNTEPLLRLNLEAADVASVEACVQEVSAHLGTRVDH